MVFELGVPPRSVRKKVLRSYVGSYLDERVLDQLAQSEELSPASIENAARVTKIVCKQRSGKRFDNTFAQLLNQTLKAQGCKELAIWNQTQTNYNTEFLNADMDVLAIIEGLRAGGSGRLCFYGPPGTGKTEFARHIAAELDRPLVTKKASDLMSKWVGETEQNIAEAFSEARRQGAVLVLDEVDSFLQSRSSMRSTWEHTQVNEMLTQMENFDGIFIASTNMMGELDPAALRRFDAKIKFDYLSQGQLSRVFAEFCEQSGFDVDLQKMSRRFSRLTAVALGDFALLRRQARLQAFRSAEDVMSRLENEQALKGVSPVSVGFI